MARIIILSIFMAVLGVGLSLTASSSADDDRERDRAKGREGAKGRGASIESIMKTMHGRNGLTKALDAMLQAKEVNWDAVQATTKKMVPLATDLGKRKPDKGTKESWAELTEVYADFATQLDAAAAKKDLAATKDNLHELNSSCNKCHGRHKGGRN